MIEAAGAAIGASGIHGISRLDAHATTGTMIGEKALWGRGYGAESVRLRTEYAFLQLNLHKLQTEVFADNHRSRRALERSGYRETGIAREHFWREGRWHDLWRAELLRSDWEQGRFGTLPVGT